MAVDLHVTVAGRLAAVDQRYTAGRRALVDVLTRAGRPLSIPEILDGDRSLRQSSAYRNLSALESAGVVRRVLATDEFARYELAEELTSHHHHLVCVTCGAVEDVTLPPRLEATVDRAVTEVAGATGFRADSHRLDLIGVCRGCR